MAGEIRKLIDELLHVRSARAPGLEHFVKVNLLLNGIDPDKFTAESEDDFEKIAALQKMIRDYRVSR